MRRRRRRPRLLPLVPLLAALACSAGAPGPETAAAGAEGARASRVILISLDGAATEDLHRFYGEGEFSERRGFRRFFEEGQVAERLIPVDPTLTSPNHASLSTGAPPARHGIVSNTFHRRGDPVGRTVRGFDLPLETEALWETARRQGKRTVSLTWPHAHGQDGRRSADYGVLYVNDPEAPARIVDLERAAWGEPDRAPLHNLYSPVRMARIATPGAGGAAVQVRLYALDRSDDGRVNYDAIEVLPEVAGVQPHLLQAGGWARVVFDPDVRGEDQGWAVSHARLLELAPDLARVRIYLGGVYRTRAFPHGYLLKLQRAGLYWPGAPDDEHLDAFWAGGPGIDQATWLEQAENLARFYGVLKALLFGPDDWDLALLYLPHIDEAGHQFHLASPRQPGYDPERVRRFESAIRALWRMADELLADLHVGLAARSDTAVVVVSDHGMHPLHSTLDPNVLLRREGVQAADDRGRVVAAGTAAWAVPSSAMAHVYLTVPESERAPLTDRLRRLFAEHEVGGERPVARVVTRKEAGAMGLDHPNAGDLILFATPGWLFGRLDSGAVTAPADHLGAHGYLSSEPRMHGIYLAVGPGVKPGRIETVRTTEVAGRVAALLGIDPPQPLPSFPQPPLETNR